MTCHTPITRLSRRLVMEVQVWDGMYVSYLTCLQYDSLGSTRNWVMNFFFQFHVNLSWNSASERGSFFKLTRWSSRPIHLYLDTHWLKIVASASHFWYRPRRWSILDGSRKNLATMKCRSCNSKQLVTPQVETCSKIHPTANDGRKSSGRRLNNYCGTYLEILLWSVLLVLFGRQQKLHPRGKLIWGCQAFSSSNCQCSVDRINQRFSYLYEAALAMW